MSTLQRLLSEKKKLKSKFCNYCMAQIFLWKPLLFPSHNVSVCTEMISILQNLFPEKNALRFNSSTNAAWQKYFCENQYFFLVKMHCVLAEITSILQKLFSERNALSLNSTSIAWLIIMHSVLTKIISAWQILFSAKKMFSLNSALLHCISMN